MAEWHHEIIDCRIGGRKTGAGASFSTWKKARDSFAAIKKLEVPSDRAEFLIDLRDDSGVLVDTVLLDSAGFKHVTGEEPKSPEEYDRIDQSYWKAVFGRPSV